MSAAVAQRTVELVRSWTRRTSRPMLRVEDQKPGSHLAEGRRIGTDWFPEQKRLAREIDGVSFGGDLRVRSDSRHKPALDGVAGVVEHQRIERNHPGGAVDDCDADDDKAQSAIGEAHPRPAIKHRSCRASEHPTHTDQTYNIVH